MHAIKGSLHQIERFAKDFQRQRFDCVRLRVCRGKFPKSDISPALLADHLERPLSAREKREAQNFLPFHHLLKRGLAFLWRNRSSQADKTTDVVRDICSRQR
jgi:hypothetical protein